MKVELILTLLMAALAAQSGVEQKEQAGKRLRKHMPKVTWNASSAATVDIDCDGKPDTYMWGTHQVTRTFFIGGKDERHTYRQVAIGFELAGSQKPQMVSIPFRKDTGYYGFCAEPKTFDVQPLSCEWEGGLLPGCKPAKRCQSMWVRDGECGEFFIFWDSSRKAVTWVRP